MRRLWLALVLVALTAQSAAADGVSDFEQARALRKALDFTGALAAVRRGLAAGDNFLSNVVDAYMLAGELAAGLDRNDEAVDAFQHALELDDRTLPAGTSPKILAPLQTAQVWAQAHGRLRFHAEDEPDAVVLIIDNDPLGLVAGARGTLLAEAGKPETDFDVAGTTRLRIPVPATAARWGLRIVDEHGNELTNMSSVRPGAFIRYLARPPLYARWEIWAIAALGATAVGTVEGLRMRAAQDEWDRLRAEDGQHDFSELAAVEHRGRAAAIGADVGLAAGVVTAAIAAVLAIHEVRRGSYVMLDQGPSVAIFSDGIGVGFAGRF